VTIRLSAPLRFSDHASARVTERGGLPAAFLTAIRRELEAGRWKPRAAYASVLVRVDHLNAVLDLAESRIVTVFAVTAAPNGR
jgi:hypothetical protein